MVFIYFIQLNNFISGFPVVESAVSINGTKGWGLVYLDADAICNVNRLHYIT